MRNYTQGLIDYIEAATSPIQAVSTSVSALEENGFEALSMSDNWKLSQGGKYYVRPYPSMLVCFTIGTTPYIQEGFRIITSHTDFPSFKIKPDPEITTHGYLKLNTEVYGGPILDSWFDRPISLAGQVVLRSDTVFKPNMVEIDFRDPIMVIPSLAIHFKRHDKKEAEKNPQEDLLPILKMVEDEFVNKDYLISVLAKKLACDVTDILDFDLYMYVTEKGQVIGLDQSFISAPRIDNLAMVYSSVTALIESSHYDGISMAACFDNEEIGSTSKQGADSDLLHQIIKRIGHSLNGSPEQIYRLLDQSFMISADGAHATHPNATTSCDITNFPVLNKGITIKISAKQNYATDSVTSGIFQQLCHKAEVPYQRFVNRSDIPGGKTLGPIATKYLPIKAVDVGVPMLAMHATRELMGVKDLEDIIKVFKVFYENKA
ncbi:MAG: M18 family aminopeptidase [Vallitaleaceae bacterium]|nr:M18 family aminopeptidase [Vallitaleaceae bacterium]